MRDWTTRGLNQAAVYWSPGSEDGFGRISFGTPVQIRCHWEDMQEEVRTRTGEQLVSRAFVVVDRDLEEGGFLYLGTLRDANAAGSDPQDINAAHKIIKAGGVPTFRGKLKASSVWL